MTDLEQWRLRKILELISSLDDLLSFEDVENYRCLRDNHIEPLRKQMTTRLRDLEKALMAEAKR